jgi:hypothetical protein
MKETPIFILMLPKRIENRLNTMGINTLGKLSKTNKLILLKQKGFGNKSLFEIYKCIMKYIGSHNKASTLINMKIPNIDDALHLLMQYINSNTINNHVDQNNYSKYYENLFNYLSTSISSMSIFSIREKIILRERLRFFSNNMSSRTHTLEGIATMKTFSTTRERVRQIENKLIKKIEKVILIYNHNNKKEYQLFKKCIIDNGNNIGLIRIPRDISILMKNINIDEGYFSRNFFIYLLTNIIYQKKDNLITNIRIKNNEFKYILFNKDFDNNKTMRVINEANKIIKMLNITSIREDELLRSIGYNLEDLNDNERKAIREILSTISKFKYSQIGIYQKKHIGSSWHAYKILDIKKRPMHKKELAELVKASIGDSNRSEYTIYNSLINNPEIHSIGKGVYALTKWGMKKYVRTRHEGSLSVKNLVKECIENNTNPTKIEIVQYVQSKRDASIHTINQVISDIGYKLNKINISHLIVKCLRENGASNINEIFDYVIQTKPNTSIGGIYQAISKLKLIKDSNNIYSFNNVGINSEVRQNKLNVPTIRIKLEEYLRKYNNASLEDILDYLSNYYKKNVSVFTIKSYLSDIGVRQNSKGKYSLLID